MSGGGYHIWQVRLLSLPQTVCQTPITPITLFLAVNSPAFT
jgi:hypothetical protein